MVAAALVLLAVLLGAGLFLGCCVFSGPRYQGPKSDHFDGRRFQNPVPVAHASTLDVLKWVATREPDPWEEVEGAKPGPPPPERVGEGELRVTFVNHATVLVQMDGVNLLTDPIWSERASPVSFAGPRRVRPPGIRFEDLPPIDVVLISHNHYDHLDVPTLRRLFDEHRPRFVVGLGHDLLLEREGIAGAMALDWWESVEIDGLKVTGVPAQHFSNRGLCDRDATLWGGYVVEGKAGVVYFAGDTGMGPHFEEVRERFGPLRLALLPIGAFLPRWFMKGVHISPEEAVKAHRILEAGTSVAIHFGTFPLADDGRDEPVERLEAALGEAGVPKERFWVLGFGEGRGVPAHAPSSPNVIPAHNDG